MNSHAPLALIALRSLRDMHVDGVQFNIAVAALNRIEQPLAEDEM